MGGEAACRGQIGSLGQDLGHSVASLVATMFNKTQSHTVLVF